VSFGTQDNKVTAKCHYCLVALGLVRHIIRTLQNIFIFENAPTAKIDGAVQERINTPRVPHT